MNKEKQIGKKNHDLRVKLSEEQLDKIEKKARAVGMNVSAYCRYLLLNTNVKMEISQ